MEIVIVVGPGGAKYEENQRRQSFRGHAQQLGDRGLFIVLIVSIVLLFANFAYLNTQSNHDKQYIGHAGELRVLSQRIGRTPPKRRRARARRSSS